MPSFLAKRLNSDERKQGRDHRESKQKRERQKISIGRKSKSVGGRGWDLFRGGREEFCGDHRLHIFQETKQGIG